MSQQDRIHFRNTALRFVNRISRRSALLFSLLLALLCEFSYLTQAASVTVGWPASPDTTVAGYKVYFGTSPTALASVYNAGGNLSATIPGLDAGQVYYFGVCAYNSAGLESLLSATASCSLMLAPSISLTSPTDGASANAPASFQIATAVAANGHVINKVEFLSNGTVIGEDLSEPYSFIVSGVPVGTYSISARLVYDETYTISSATASVTVSAPVLNPSITLAFPNGLAAYSAPASIALSANVNANGHSIAKVQFLSGSTIIGEVVNSPYSTTWSGVAAGNYSVVARLVYDGNLILDSNPTTVSVSGTQPSIAITSPTTGASGTSPGKATVSATVVPNGQSISKVQFYANGALIGESTAAPYSIVWSSIKAGTWNLQASALYGQGSSVSSSPVSINVGSLPAPWSSTDIGAVKAAGSAWISSSTLDVAGAGVINSSSDSFRFLYQPLSGDGQMVARIDSMLIGSSGGGSIGIMIRESLTSGSRHAFMGVSTAGVYRWEKRSSTGGSTSVNQYSTAPSTGAWIKLVRTGNTVTGFTSTDGANWTKRTSTTLSMASNIYIGYAVASGSKSATTPVTFSGSQVVP